MSNSIHKDFKLGTLCPGILCRGTLCTRDLMSKTPGSLCRRDPRSHSPQSQQLPCVVEIRFLKFLKSVGFELSF